MEDLLKKLNIEFNETKRPKALQTLNDLIEAAEKLVEGGNVENFAARSLSRTSGYSLGALIKRLGRIENIFIYAITSERSKKIQTIGKSLEAINRDADVTDFVNELVDITFKSLQAMNPRVMRYYEKRAATRAEYVTDVFTYTNEIITPLKKVIANNQSATMRTIGDHEMQYICRAIFLFIERPFVEGDLIAGTEIHRKMAVENITSLLVAK